jgi:hypothetical protein
MPSELTLFFNDESGQEQEVSVTTNPFTIGRQEGNELVLSDAGLSRRHALITVFNGIAQITDCGSQNGTFLNGQQISGNAVLQNGDVISIGYSCKLRVRLAETKETVAPSLPNHSPVSPQPESSPPLSPTPSADAFKLSPAMMAIVATGAILLVAGVLIAVVALRQPKPSDNNNGTGDPVFNSSTPAPTEGATPHPTMVTPTGNDQLERNLVQAIRNISNDQNYPFTPAVLADLKRKTEQFATPTLANSLRAISTRGAAAADHIRTQGLKPGMLFYLALAETNGGQSGDPVAVAQQAVPDVQFLRGHFGSNFADQSLLVIAAYKIPGGSKKSHPLLEPLRRLVRNPQTDRNVWFLREKGALSDTAYDFVLRFLAYGAIAQNPRQFGLDAPALIF